MYFCVIIMSENKRKERRKKMKRLVTLGAVHTHTHTDSLVNKIVSNDKSFNIPKNRRNLKENCKIYAVFF